MPGRVGKSVTYMYLFIVIRWHWGRLLDRERGLHYVRTNGPKIKFEGKGNEVSSSLWVYMSRVTYDVRALS